MSDTDDEEIGELPNLKVTKSMPTFTTTSQDIAELSKQKQNKQIGGKQFTSNTTSKPERRSMEEIGSQDQDLQRRKQEKLSESPQAPLDRESTNESLEEQKQNKPKPAKIRHSLSFARPQSKNPESKLSSTMSRGVLVGRGLSFKKKNALSLNIPAPRDRIRIFTATWNVGNAMPIQEEMEKWLPVMHDQNLIADVSQRRKEQSSFFLRVPELTFWID
jgi:hypothetical protein